MLKPFYNKKKNIDDRLLPAVTAADAGKVLGVTEEGKFGLVEGGGNSDFSTATFTVINNAEETYNLYIPRIAVDNASILLISYGFQSEDSCNCVLYKGKATAQFEDGTAPDQSAVTTSGGITYEADQNLIEITGDGTLTISY